MSVELVARAQQLSGDFDEAEGGYVAALQELDVLGLRSSAWSVTPLVWLAETQWQAARFDAAEANLREALSLSLFYNDADNGSTMQTQVKLGSLLQETGKTHEGLALLRDVETKLAGASVNVLSTWRSLYGTVLLSQGRIDEADRLFGALVDELIQRSLSESLYMARALRLRANAKRLLGQVAQAAADSDNALQLFRRVVGAAALPRAFLPFYSTRARVQLAQGEVSAANETSRLVLDGDWESADALESQLVRARVELAEARPSEARTATQWALGRLRGPSLLGRLPLLEAEAFFLLGEARMQLGEYEAGCADLAQAATVCVRNEVVSSPIAVEIARARRSCGQPLAAAESLTASP